MDQIKRKKAVLISAGAVFLVVIIAAVCFWYFQIKKPYDLAVTNFNAATAVVEAKNAELDAAIGEIQAVLVAQEPPYDELTLKAAETAAADAERLKLVVPTIPDKTDDINVETQKLFEPLDYSTTIAGIQKAQEALQHSIKQMKQVTNPPEDFILRCVRAVADVTNAQAVTEDNDPNGNLNKAGGYTAAVYFESSLVDPNQVYGNDLIDKGTSAGGCLEVYADVEEAEKRNIYLSAFDGGILSAGSHSVIGTIVVRTSDELTATQQKNLEQQIFDVLLTV